MCKSKRFKEASCSCYQNTFQADRNLLVWSTLASVPPPPPPALPTKNPGHGPVSCQCCQYQDRQIQIIKSDKLLFLCAKIYYALKEKLMASKMRSDCSEEERAGIEESIDNMTPPATVYGQLLHTLNQHALPGKAFTLCILFYVISWKGVLSLFPDASTMSSKKNIL